MDNANLWTRRSNASKLSLSMGSDNRDSNNKTDSPRTFNSGRRLGDSSHGKSNPFNAISPLASTNSPSASASSAFGLGSGAFASFGSAKTPKTPGAAGSLDINGSEKGEKETAAEAATEKQKSKSNTSISTSATASSTSSEHPLKSTWALFYRPPTSKYSDYEKSTIKLASISTVENFWAIYSHLKRPSQLPSVSDYHIFKEGIRPVWEDEANKRGGKWIVRLKKGVADRYWEDLLCAIVGDQFMEAGEEVCGAVLSVRSGEDVLNVWTKNDGGRNIKIRETIKRLLAFPPDTNIVWKSHDDSIAQRSALDEARQQKAGAGQGHLGHEKRRQTIHEDTEKAKNSSRGSSAALKASYMISAVHRKISEALSSFTFTKQPKLLKRPSPDISSQPDDPTRSPPEASMPYSRSSKSSNTSTKRPSGGKATEFLNENFGAGGEEDDPIESFPLRPTVRRVKATSHSSSRKAQQSPISIGPKTAVSKPEINHRHLLVDADEKSLFYSTSLPDPNAVLISIPGSTRPNQNSSSNMRLHTPYRHINTFEQQKQSQVSSSSRNRLQPPRTRDPADYSSKAPGPRSTSNHSYRTGNGEPPFKRPRLDETKIPYVKDEAFGAVSPVFSSKLDSDVTTTRRRTSRTPARVRSPPKMVANDIPLTVHEYGSVEKMVKPLPASKVTSESLEVKSSKALLTGRHQPSDESDLETFTRQAKRQRYGRNDSPQVNSDHEVQVVEVAASDSEASKHTPEEIKSLFPPSYSPNHAQLSDGPHSSTLGALPTTTSSSQRPTESSLVASMEGVGDGKAAIKYHLMRKGTSALKGRRQKVSGSKSPDKQSAGFPLRWITYGLLPLSSDYYISIRDDMLEIRYSESQLSDDPVWHPIPLSKVFKILRGTDDCFILKLEFSNREGQSNQPMWLEFTSGEHRDKFVALVNRTNLPHMVLRKEDDFMFKAFQRQLEETQQRLNDNMHQPIRKEQKISDFTSPHFSNQQSISASNVPKQKMVNQLQSSSSNIKPSGADSRKRTVITGRDRANQVSPTLSGHLVATSMKSVSDQAQPTTSNKIGPASDRLPATRSGVKSERFTDQIEDDTMPRKKYSLEHGLGDPWKTPLIYPKTGKRRETVQFDDLFRLDEDEFLNDNLIGFFLRYLEYHLELTNPALAKRVYFYNSYFFERLMQTSRGKKGINYESVQKWTRNVDIFTHDFIVVPVNESFHWYVVIICNLSKVRPVDDNEEEDVESERVSSKDPAIVPDKEETRTILVPEEVQDQPTAKTTESLSHLSLSDNDKQLDELALSTKPLSSPRPSSTPKKTSTGRRKSARHSLPKRDVSAPMIITFDSLGAPRSSTCTALRQYIVEEAKSKKGWDIDGRLIKGMTAKGIPTQPNFSDCGLYLCAYMEKFILDPANFIGKILQREMDAEKDMPLLPSEALRSRMRGMIQELHNRQESEETEMPIPEVGRILLSEISPASPGGNSEPRTPLREDSEDELQQDHAKFEIFDAERAHSDAIMRKDKHEQTTPRSTMSSDEKPLLSKTAMTVNEILAKIDGSPSGTREAAITIDEDEDIQPVPKNVATKRSPAKDDFFDHPSELNAPMSAHKASPTPRKPSKATITQQMQRQRGRPRASLDTTTQKGKGASEKHTHRWSRSRSRATSADSTDTTYLKSGKSYERHDDREAKKPEIVVVVPDSQGSEEVEAETKRNGNGNEELHQEQDQEILDGV